MCVCVCVCMCVYIPSNALMGSELHDGVLEIVNDDFELLDVLVVLAHRLFELEGAEEEFDQHFAGFYIVCAQ